MDYLNNAENSYVENSSNVAENFNILTVWVFYIIILTIDNKIIFKSIFIQKEISEQT